MHCSIPPFHSAESRHLSMKPWELPYINPHMTAIGTPIIIIIVSTNINDYQSVAKCAYKKDRQMQLRVNFLRLYITFQIEED